MSSDNYNSFSGDSYFSRSFWGKSARVFVSFWGGFLLPLVPGFGRRGWRPKAGTSVAPGVSPRPLIVGDSCGYSFVALGFMALCRDSRRQIPG